MRSIPTPLRGCETLPLPGIFPPEPSTSAPSSTSSLTTFDLFGNAIFSPGSAAGPSPSLSPAGPTTAKSGPAHVHVSRFRAQDNAEAMPTSDTSGPLFTASSPSAALQRSLESRLRARMAVNGSPEYALTWSTWDMPSGPPICRLRASARRTSGSDCSGWPTVQAREVAAQLAGWPTPQTADINLSRGSEEYARKKLETSPYPSLALTAQLAGWATPGAIDTVHATNSWKGQDRRTAPTGKLSDAVQGVAGWPTPMAGNPGTDTYNPAGNTDSSRKTVALVSGWPTPATPSGGRSVSIETMDATGRTTDGRKHTASLEHAVKCAGWGTPTAQDAKHATLSTS